MFGCTLYCIIYVFWCIDFSGFSPPHGLFSPELGHGTDHIKEHLTSYAAEGQSETGSDAIHQVQQPVAAVEPSEPATVDDTRHEVKKIIWWSTTNEYIYYRLYMIATTTVSFFPNSFVRRECSLIYFIYYCSLNPMIV